MVGGDTATLFMTELSSSDVIMINDLLLPQQPNQSVIRGAVER